MTERQSVSRLRALLTKRVAVDSRAVLEADVDGKAVRLDEYAATDIASQREANPAWDLAQLFCDAAQGFADEAGESTTFYVRWVNPADVTVGSARPFICKPAQEREPDDSGKREQRLLDALLRQNAQLVAAMESMSKVATGIAQTAHAAQQAQSEHHREELANALAMASGSGKGGKAVDPQEAAARAHALTKFTDTFAELGSAALEAYLQREERRGQH